MTTKTDATPLKRSNFRFVDRLRVRWAEIDAQQIVFNGHYLMYFDTAIAGYWRAMAMPYHETMAALGGDLYVRKASLDYLGSARYDDLIDVGLRCRRIGNSSIVFDGAVFLQERLLVGCELVYVFADPASQTSRPVPPKLRDALQAFEAGEPMTTLSVGGWADLKTPARALRTRVFVDEQKIPAELEWDDADAGAQHAVVFNRFEQPLATGRLLQHAPGVGRIGRMAVHQAVRGSGIGRGVLDALVDLARRRGDHEVVLHAQMSAMPFYLRAGFAAQGETFVEAGIEHVEMLRGL